MLSRVLRWVPPLMSQARFERACWEAIERDDANALRGLTRGDRELPSFTDKGEHIRTVAERSGSRAVLAFMDERERTQQAERRAKQERALLKKLMPAQRAAKSLQRRVSRGRHLLFAEGDYSPLPSVAERYLVFSVKEAALAEVADFWLAPADVKSLLSALRTRCEVIQGNCDATYATRWTHAWAKSDGVFRAWTKRGLILNATKHGVEVRRWRRFGPAGESSYFSSADVLEVHVGVTDVWARHEVHLVTADGERHEVAGKFHAIVHIDPTYDALDLFCDTWWARELGKGLADATGARLTIDPDIE